MILLASIILFCATVAGEIAHRRWDAFKRRKESRSAIHSVTVHEFEGTIEQWAEKVVRTRRG